ncbi:transposase [Streptomyces sp. SID13031]|uniref:IS701 family transposase n=1 Tax=Streptomyces sp. SID13031 TaxID=2706046 RepID=UPI0013CBD225|nr:transposase [Streptomyces sp. SID13031]NEA34902.1 transposase [Streptomyces sp. SID13031]
MTARSGPHGSTFFNRFAADLFGQLPRADQRRWAEVYLQGLLTTPGKKTVRRMAAAVTDSATAAQALHQFVNASPWEWEPIQTELIRWVEQQTRPRSWTIAPAVLPKRGGQSCGVHRRFIPQAGRTVNCQIGIGAFLSSATGDLPVAWNMLLPEEWSDAARRRRARIPGPVTAASPAVGVLDLLNSLALRGAAASMPDVSMPTVSRPEGSIPEGSMPVVADLVGYLDTRALIHGLVERGYDFVIAVPDNLLLQPGSHLAARQCAEGAPVRAAQFIDERAGHTTTHPTGLAYLPRAQTRPGLQRTYRLFDRREDSRGRPGGLWLTNMTNRPFGELLALVDGPATTAATIGRMERDFGLRDFEGRSYPGWHHHMTLTSAAYAYQQVATHRLQEPDRPVHRRAA